MLPRAAAGIFGFAFFDFDVVFDFYEVVWATHGEYGRPLTGLGRAKVLLALLALRSTQFDGGNMDQTDFEAASKMKQVKRGGAALGSWQVKRV